MRTLTTIPVPPGHDVSTPVSGTLSVPGELSGTSLITAYLSYVKDPDERWLTFGEPDDVSRPITLSIVCIAVTGSLCGGNGGQPEIIRSTGVLRAIGSNWPAGHTVEVGLYQLPAPAVCPALSAGIAPIVTTAARVNNDGTFVVSLTLPNSVQPGGQYKLCAHDTLTPAQQVGSAELQVRSPPSLQGVYALALASVLLSIVALIILALLSEAKPAALFTQGQAGTHKLPGDVSDRGRRYRRRQRVVPH
jgi:hypothetical protein